MVKKPQADPFPFPAPTSSDTSKTTPNPPEPNNIAPTDPDPVNLTTEEKADLALRTTAQPMAASLLKEARLGLDDLSKEEQLELAVQFHERIGKASGYIPEFPSLTENMKAAYLGGVRDIWIAAQRKARSYRE